MAMPASFLVAAIGAPAPWYDGIQAVKVFAPGDAVEQFAWNLYNTTSTAQFGSARHALLLKAGKYSAQIPVGFYTSLIGVGASARDVTVESFYTLDDPQVGNACDNFWRSVEGLTATMTSQDITWAASQAAPLRRVHVLGSLTLSEEGPGTHWSSGGYLADSVIDGTLKMGTQQQYFVRNSNISNRVVGKSMNYVFMGVDGAPVSASGLTRDHANLCLLLTPRVRSLVRAGQLLRWQDHRPAFQYATED